MKKTAFTLASAIILICGIAVSVACSSKSDTSAVDPTEDSSQFVTLTDVVPDAILEIRYYGTYNFVGFATMAPIISWERALMVIWSLQPC